MRKLIAFAFAVLVLLYAYTEDLQITIDPGYRIIVDGNEKGISNEFLNGLIVSDLAPGQHKVIIRKEGYNDLIYNVNIDRNKTCELVINTKSESSIKQLGEKDNLNIVRQTGNLIIKSLPLYANVVLNGKNIGQTDLMVEKMVAGPISLVFEYKGQKLKYDGVLRNNDSMTIKADFSKSICIISSSLDTKMKVIINIKDTVFCSGSNQWPSSWYFNLGNEPYSDLRANIGTYEVASNGVFDGQKRSFTLTYEGGLVNNEFILTNTYKSLTNAYGYDNSFSPGEIRIPFNGNPITLYFSVVMQGILSNNDRARTQNWNTYCLDNGRFELHLKEGKTNTITLNINKNSFSYQVNN